MVAVLTVPVQTLPTVNLHAQLCANTTEHPGEITPTAKTLNRYFEVPLSVGSDDSGGCDMARSTSKILRPALCQTWTS